MTDAQRIPEVKALRPTFAIACWVLALLAFCQLIALGTAIALNSIPLKPTDSQPVTTPPATQLAATSNPAHTRSIEEILAAMDDDMQVPPLRDFNPAGGSSDLTLNPSSQTSKSSSSKGTGIASVPKHEITRKNLKPHNIANPEVAQLVEQAQNLHLDGDLINALVKLEEAKGIDPAEAAVLYQLGLIHEDMGMEGVAADYYSLVQQMGIAAGEYFPLAANKLTKGIDMPQVASSFDLSIGPVASRKSNNDRTITVTIPLLARPNHDINLELIEVRVHFFDRVSGRDIQRSIVPNSEIEKIWLREPVNWQDSSREELLEVIYHVPETNSIDAHLLGGRREYYGQVIELVYDGTVIDQQAFPRRLNSFQGSDTQNNDMPLWLPDFPQQGLLPSKDDTNAYDNLPLLPPLPDYE